MSSDAAVRPSHAPPTDAVAAVVHADPYPFYATLRAERPFDDDARLGLRVAADAATVEAVLAHPACRVRPPAEPVPSHLRATRSGAVFGRLVRMSDGAAHARLKPALVLALGTLDPAGMARAAGARAAGLRADGADDLDGDALDRLMFALPVACVAAALGLQGTALDTAVDATAAFVRGLAPGAGDGDRRRGDGAADALIAQITTNGIAGPLGRLDDELRAAGITDSLTIAANALGLLMQTFEATAGLIGQSLVAAARRPAVWDAARPTPEGADRFVREVLRHDPPVQNTRRFVAEGATIAGRPVPAGTAILVVLAAANRDPAANPDPDRFDPERSDPRHFSFGTGRHACPGAALAVAIASGALRGLGRLGDATGWLARPAGYRPSPNARIPRFAPLPTRRPAP